MNKIGIFYGSTMGETKEVAETISNQMGNERVDLFNVANVSGNKVKEYDLLIFGSSTWGFGELQDDWNVFIDDLKGIDFSAKKVALFGLGDQVVYTDTFVDAIGIIYQVVKDNGADIVGQVPVEGYEFSDSAALVDDQFVGLPLDNNNQFELTDERIQNWTASLQRSFE